MRATILSLRSPVLTRSPTEVWRAQTDDARLRLRESLWPAIQASAGAGVAWWIAHTALGHPAPFFAPIAAAVSLSTAPFGRSRRALQLVGGVLVGIVVAELMKSIVGTGAVSIALVVLVTLSVSLVVGIGLFGQGMMFVNQAAAAAVLVVALHRAGTGTERVVDALVGAGTAFVIGVVLFPAHPLPLLRRAERAMLVGLASAMEQVSVALAENRPLEPEWALAVGSDIHRRLAALADARMTARRVVAVAPRRMLLRGAVADEERRVAGFDLLGNAVLSLVRTAITVLDGGGPLAPELCAGVHGLAAVLAELSAAPQPWSPELVASTGTRVTELIAAIAPQTADGSPLLATIARRTALDLLLAVGHATD
jgi:uncharacterized membrane protein YgaE (UPF0421/DUF939 family)